MLYSHHLTTHNISPRFWVWDQRVKNISIFSTNFYCKKIVAACYGLNLMPPTFHIASLNRYTPNFSGVGQKLTWCQQFGLQIFPKWGDAEKPPPKNPFFRCFFWQNKFSRPNGRLLPIACHTYLESILQGVRFLLAKETRLSGIYDNESYREEW